MIIDVRSMLLTSMGDELNAVPGDMSGQLPVLEWNGGIVEQWNAMVVCCFHSSEAASHLEHPLGLFCLPCLGKPRGLPMNSAINGDYILAQLMFQQKRAHFQELGFKAAPTPPGDPASSYTPLGGGANLHYHIMRPK